MREEAPVVWLGDCLPRDKVVATPEAEVPRQHIRYVVGDVKDHGVGALEGDGAAAVNEPCRQEAALVGILFEGDDGAAVAHEVGDGRAGA